MNLCNYPLRLGNCASETAQQMHVIFYTADLQRRAFKLFGNGTQVRVQRFPKDFVAQERPALFGREDEMNVNRR